MACTHHRPARTHRFSSVLAIPRPDSAFAAPTHAPQGTWSIIQSNTCKIQSYTLLTFAVPSPAMEGWRQTLRGHFISYPCAHPLVF
mgnify:CR=1 FL=1